MKKLILILAMLALHSATHATTLPVFLDSTPIDPDLLASLVDDDYNPDAFGLDLNEPLPGITPAAAASTHQSSQESLSVAPAQQRGKRVVLPLAILARDRVTPETADRRRRRARVKPVNPVIAQTSDEHDGDDPLTNKPLFKCEHCEYKTAIKINIDQHLKIHEKNAVSAQCSECLGFFSIKSGAYKTHATNRHPGISISWAFWLNSKELSLRDAAPLLTPTEYTCLTCKHECSNKNALKNHLKLHEQNVVSAKCSECSGFFSIEKSGYKKHATLDHSGKSVSWTFWLNNEELSAEDIALLFAERKTTCPICKQECSDKNVLEGHLKLHEENVVSAKCSECSGFFSIEHNGYNHHVYKSHPGKSVSWTFWQNNEELSAEDVALLFAAKKSTCHYCKQECPNKNVLEIHLKLHEENVVSAKCSECSGFFSIENSGYKQHAIKCHPGKSITWTFWQNGEEVSVHR